MHLSQLFIYPIKSLRGISLQSASVVERGLQHDRRYQLTDKNGTFLTQRTLGKLALFHTAIEANELVVSCSGELGTDHIRLPLEICEGESKRVTTWDQATEAILSDEVVNDFFSEKIGMPCDLVFMPNYEYRPVDTNYVPENTFQPFTDGYPFLVISEASLRDLNSRLEAPIGMDRFRPNFVVAETEPYAEDGWHSFTIGEALFKAVKPCSRCVMTTVDQSTGEKGKEPLRTLAGYRTVNNKVLFGQNLIFIGGSTTLKVGDTVRTH
jgi:uncharacterized protein YcbX